MGALKQSPASASERPVAVTEAGASEEREWNEFVLAHPHGTPFHLIAWKTVIQKNFGYKPHYLVARDAAGICGVLPLFLVKNILVGKALISSPFAVYGGVLADCDATRASLTVAVRLLGERLGVQYVELRNAYQEQCVGFERISRYVTFTQQIGDDEEAILGGIPRKTRAAVRKSLKAGFAMRLTDDLSAFEDLYSRNLQRLGTPSFPTDYFADLIAAFRGMIDVREVLLDGKLASAVMTFYFRDQVMPYYGASDPAFNAAAPNNFMYYDLMRWGGQHRFRLFDFGRSKKEGSGSYDFKAHWGMLERELPYEMLLVKGKQLPNYSPNNPRFSLAIKIWQHLPLAVTRRLGPHLLRLVP
jgi:FemAB-related protein (PEP-CTERM system-associated)